jgi:hypothetical protein
MRCWVIWVIMSKATKKKHKANKIRLIILEGESDKHFFDGFKKKFHLRLLDIIKIGKNLNFHRIDREIESSLKTLGYKEVWLVMDLKSRKIGTTTKNYSTPKEMMGDYKKNLKNLVNVDYVIMVQDLECWLLLYYSKPGRKNTETIKNAEQELRRSMKLNVSISKVTTVRRLTRNIDFWEKLRQNRYKNKSFNDFLEKVEKVNSAFNWTT